MRFLMACLQFPTEPGRSSLTTELARALVAAGHDVEVLLVDWDQTSAAPHGSCRTWNGIRIVQCRPALVARFGRLLRHASKFVLTGRRAGRLARTEFDLSRFDGFIAWAPAVVVAPLVALARRAGIPNRLLFIWDFFPDHQREIGLVPLGAPYRIARAWEQHLMDQFTVLLCTLPQNTEYLRAKFRVRENQSVRVAPIWTDMAPVPQADRTLVRRRYGLPSEGDIAVFGGQLVEGRGFDQILAAAAIAREASSQLMFLFVGEGRLMPRLRAAAEENSNVRWLPAMPREEYLELLGACDVGMVATAPGVSSFSVPSKTIDYMRAGLPVVCAVEEGNALAKLLEQYRVGRAVAFDDARGYFEVAEALAAGPRIAEAAKVCLDEVFHVRHVVTAILNH